MEDKPNKVAAVLKVVVAVEFCDDDATEETLRYAVEQDLEDAGYEVDDVSILKEQEAQSVLSNRVCEGEQFKYVRKGFCPKCHQEVEWLLNRKHCGFCGQAVKWDE